MANYKSADNLPNNSYKKIPVDKRKEITCSLLDLRNMGKLSSSTSSPQELEERINKYFEYCENTGTPLGVETLSLALGVSRQEFTRWTKGEHCTEEWQNVCLGAKQVLAGFIEVASMTGAINPASAIFLQKNNFGYKDTVEIEEPAKEEKQAVTLEDIKKQLALSDNKQEEPQTRTLNHLSFIRAQLNKNE